MSTLSTALKSEGIRRLKADHALQLLIAASAIVVVTFLSSFTWMLNQWFVVEKYSPGPAVPILASIAFWHALKKNGALPQISRRTTFWALGVVAALAAIVYVGKEHPRYLPLAGFLSAASYSVLFAGLTVALLYSGTLLSKAISPRSAQRVGLLGLTIAVLSLAVHFLALRGDLPRASIIAYIALLFAIAWYLHGWSVARKLAFPYAMLFLMVPLEFIDETFGIPMRLMATGSAVFLMRLVGLDVVQTGTWFAIGSMDFSVDAPCSGLKSLIALTALGATFAYVTQPSTIKKILLAACAVPIALFTNIVRLACVGISSYVLGKNFGISVFHDHAAVFLYILAILIFMSLDKKVFQAKWFKIKNF